MDATSASEQATVGITLRFRSKPTDTFRLHREKDFLKSTQTSFHSLFDVFADRIG